MSPLFKRGKGGEAKKSRRRERFPNWLIAVIFILVFTIGPYAFRPRSKLLLNSKGSKVRLSEKESSILRYLYGDGQRAVPRETLLREVWGYNSEITTHTVETHIYRLRQKIEQNAAAPAILLTEAGGYKLVP